MKMRLLMAQLDSMPKEVYPPATTSSSVANATVVSTVTPTAGSLAQSFSLANGSRPVVTLQESIEGSRRDHGDYVRQQKLAKAAKVGRSVVVVRAYLLSYTSQSLTTLKIASCPCEIIFKEIKSTFDLRWRMVNELKSIKAIKQDAEEFDYGVAVYRDWGKKGKQWVVTSKVIDEAEEVIEDGAEFGVFLKRNHLESELSGEDEEEGGKEQESAPERKKKKVEKKKKQKDEVKDDEVEEITKETMTRTGRKSRRPTK